MSNVVQSLAEKADMSFDEFVGEMRKRGCSEPTTLKIWCGEYEYYNNFNDHDMALSNLRKAADVLKVGIGNLFPKAFAERTKPGNSLALDQDYMLMTPTDADYSIQ